MTSLSEDLKTLKLQRNAEKAKNVKQRFHTKQTEVRGLIRDVKGSIEQIGEHLKDEKKMLVSDINHHKAKLSDILGYGDEVRGFDSFVADDSIDHLEIYAEFLGKQEYGRAKQNYERALQTMEMLYRAEIDRLDFSESHQSAAAQF